MDENTPWPADAKTASLPPGNEESPYTATKAVQHTIGHDADDLEAYRELTRQHEERGQPRFLIHRRNRGHNLVARSFPNETRPLILTENESTETFGPHPQRQTTQHDDQRQASAGWGVAKLGAHLGDALVLITLILAITVACHPAIVPW